MDFKIEPYKVYIKTDQYSRVKEINSSAFISDLSNWIKIDEGYGDKYHHAQGNYFENTIVNMNGVHNYIYENGMVRETTEEEKVKEAASIPKPYQNSVETDLLEMAVDYEYRLTLIELGITE